MFKTRFFWGFFGFFGFRSFRYFSTGNLMDLTSIGFFAFFSYFILARIHGDNTDERYVENSKNAMAFTGKFAIIELLALWCAIEFCKNANLAAVLTAFAYTVTVNVYALKLYILEEK